MAIHYTMTGDGDTLLVHASGFDESLEEVQAYGLAIIDECHRGGYMRVLCDEYALEYRLGTLDTYQAAAYIAERADSVRRIAIVCQPAAIADALFWEDVAVNRGLTVRMFKEMDAARAWLNGLAPSQAAA